MGHRPENQELTRNPLGVLLLFSLCRENTILVTQHMDKIPHGPP